MIQVFTVKKKERKKEIISQGVWKGLGNVKIKLS